MELTMDLAKSGFARGEFVAAQVLPHQADGYMVSLLDSRKPEKSHYLVDARRKQPRIFLTADAAINTLRTIGFKSIEIAAKP